mmetsp:Transcript_66238/g.158043  ORF Transcript_66238/g.158043 Transcript_66238/m.158043 type:complete len:234 (-) Transcript_66238:19-720(-)
MSGSANESVAHRQGVTQVLGYAEVRDLDSSSRVHKDVSKLHVPVDDIAEVQGFQALQYLHQNQGQKALWHCFDAPLNVGQTSNVHVLQRDMHAARFLVNVRIIELDKEVTLGDAEQCVNLIDELIPLGLVLHANNLDGQRHACRLVDCTAHNSSGSAAKQVCLVHLNLSHPVPQAALTNDNVGQTVSEGAILLDSPGFLLQLVPKAIQLELQIGEIHLEAALKLTSPGLHPVE